MEAAGEVTRAVATVFVGILALAAVVVAFEARAQSGSHGDGHAQGHDWYQDLKQPGSDASCCSNEDCRPVVAALGDDGIWIANVDGRPVPVPRRLVLKRIAPDGNAHICMSKAGMIYCFLEPQPKS